jgi:folate-dependent phosphoribosylglycinamide formyltransferase PurN
MLDGMKKDYEGRLNQVQYLYMKEEQSRKKCEKELEEKIRENAKQTVILEGINNQLTRENEALAGEIDKLKQNIH